MLYIVYASESGNAKALAEDFSKHCVNAGITTFQLMTLNELGTHDYAESRVVFFVSTTGSGDLPQNGKLFIGHNKETFIDLAKMQFALFCLGSRSYANFCGGGLLLETFLLEKQAVPMFETVLAGSEYIDAYQQWIMDSLPRITGVTKEKILQLNFARTFKPVAKYRLQNRVKLTQSGREVYHLVLEALDVSLNHHPGDVVQFVPKNSVHKVQQVLALLSREELEKESFLVDNEPYDLLSFLSQKVELSKISLATIKKTGKLLNDWSLLQLAANSEASAVTLQTYDLIEWMTSHSLPANQQKEFLQSLLPLEPRCYSIANDATESPNEIHLTVGLERQRFKDSRKALGTASEALCLRLQEGDCIELTLDTHPDFHLGNATEMIWVAVGTGVAPFMGFLSRLYTMPKTTWPKVVFYYGVRHPDQDFLYRDILQLCHAEGLIDLRMSFSQQGIDKQYVQHDMANRLNELSEIIERNAQVYVCGSQPMWEEVEGVLQHAVLEASNGMDEAKSKWMAFCEKQLHKEIY